MRCLMVLGLLGGTAYADPDVTPPSEVAPVVDTPPPMYTHSYSRPKIDESSGMFLDFGGGMMRMDNGGLTIHSAIASFSPQATFHHNLYFGPEFYAGDVDQDWSTNVSTMGGTQERTTHVTGDILGVNVVLGARARFGSFASGAVELTGGFRRLSVRDEDFDLVVVDVNTGGTNREVQQIDPMFELRGRIDAWVSPHFTLGVIGGKNLADTSTMTLALRFGIHFEPYDHSR